MVTLKLDHIIREFRAVGPQERLELLLEFAEGLPPLPPHYACERGRYRITECQTPVFIWAEVDDVVRVYGDVSPEAPTIRGFVGLLADLFTGGQPTEVLAIGPEVLERLGLIDSLGINRMRGMHAILFKIKERVISCLPPDVRREACGGRQPRTSS